MTHQAHEEKVILHNIFRLKYNFSWTAKISQIIDPDPDFTATCDSSLVGAGGHQQSFPSIFIYFGHQK